MTQPNAAAPEGTRLQVPIFPLPKLVLFPGTVLPLHVFEQRYREMLADCLEQERKHIAVAQLRSGWEPLYEGRPPIYDVAGIGRIARHARNADGTFDIVLEAIGRAHLQELPAESFSYRRATATLLREHTPKAGIDASDLKALFTLATRISALVKKGLPAFTLQAGPQDLPALLTDRIADQLVLDPAVRQDLLETLDIAARVRSLTAHLAQLHMALSSVEQSGSPTLH